MKRLNVIPCLFVFLAIVSIAFAQVDSPEGTVRDFYGNLKKLQLNGLPTPYDLMFLASYLSPELVELFEQNQAYRQEFQKYYPDYVPPLADGDLFSSLFEGFSEFEVTRSIVLTNEARVSVGFTYIEPHSRRPFFYEDVVKLEKTPYGWVISDVIYMGNWEYSYGVGNTLTNVLKTVLRN